MLKILNGVLINFVSKKLKYFSINLFGPIEKNLECFLQSTNKSKNNE